MTGFKSVEIDQEQDALYNVRAAIPDHMDIFADWGKRAAKFVNQVEGQFDLWYGTGPREKLDLYLTPEKSAPLHVFIHGGYWQAMDKSQSSFLAEGFLKSGVNVAMIGYDLCPDVTLREIVEEVRRAFAWLWKYADSYGYDKRKIQISGHSAGGHLVGMLLVTDWQEYGLPEGVKPIQSAISISGLFDVSELVSTSINGKLGLDVIEAKELSPQLLKAITTCPLLLAVGEKESSAFHTQSDQQKDAWDGAFDLIERMNLKGCHHLSAVDELTNTSGPLFQWAISQIKR